MEQEQHISNMNTDQNQYTTTKATPQIDELLRLLGSTAKEADTSGSILADSQPKMYGWICPICGRGLSPFTRCCPCQDKWEITY